MSSFRRCLETIGGSDENDPLNECRRSDSSSVCRQQQPRLNVRYGQGFQGTASRNHVGGQYRSESDHSGHLQYRPGNVQGGYRAPDGSNATAQITNNSGQFGYRDPRGNGYSGGYSKQNGTTSVQGGYRTRDGYSYGGGADSRGNVQGNDERPGVIPGTTDRFNAEASLQGRNSSLCGSHDLSVVGGPRVAGGNASLDRNQYQQSQDGKIGGLTGGQNFGVRFQGVNSDFNARQNRNVGGAARAEIGGRASINSVNGQGRIGVGGTNIGINANLNRDGGHLRITPPKVTVPKFTPPKISVPKVTVPKISAPKVKVPKFGF